jgi:hypothetical protein
LSAGINEFLSIEGEMGWFKVLFMEELLAGMVPAGKKEE